MGAEMGEGWARIRRGYLSHYFRNGRKLCSPMVPYRVGDGNLKAQLGELDRACWICRGKLEKERQK